MNFTIKSSFGTVGLIALNVIVFMLFGFTSTPTNELQVLQCLQTTHPECLKPAQMNEYIQCAAQTQGSADPKLCAYDVSAECVQQATVQHDCYSSQQQNAESMNFVPADFGNGKNLYTIITSMFMHASWDHLIGNMIFLFLAGVFVERRVGTLKYLLLYLLCGICATLTFYAFNMGSTTGLLGASGAISGLMGANLILDFYKPGPNDVAYPALRVPRLALFFVYQFVFQLFDTGSNVAYIAHIGGFIAGMLLIFYFKNKADVYMPTPTY